MPGDVSRKDSLNGSEYVVVRLTGVGCGIRGQDHLPDLAEGSVYVSLES